MIIRWWLMVMISNIGAGDDGEDDQSYRFLFSSGWKKLRAYHPRWKSKPCHRPFPWLIWLILDTLWKHILSAGQWVPLLIQIAPIACSRAEKNHQKNIKKYAFLCWQNVHHLQPICIHLLQKLKVLAFLNLQVSRIPGPWLLQATRSGSGSRCNKGGRNLDATVEIWHRGRHFW